MTYAQHRDNGHDPVSAAILSAPPWLWYGVFCLTWGAFCGVML
jgi:hypothetical protein